MDDNKVVKSGIWYVLSQFLTKGIVFITTPVFSRLLTTAEYGDFSNFTAWAGVVLYVVSLNLEATVVRAWYDFKNDTKRYIFSMMCLSMFSTLIWYVISCLFRREFKIILVMDSKYINLLFLLLLFEPFIVIFQTYERQILAYKWSVLSSIGLSVGTSVLSVTLIYTMKDRLYGRTLGYVIPYAVIGGIILIYFFTNAGHLKLEYWKYALPIALPYIPHLLSIYFLGSMDRVMIKQILGSSEAGLYSMAYTCGTIVTLLVSPINMAFSPWLADKLNKKDYNIIRKISIPYAFVFSACACLFPLIAPEILWIMGGDNYMLAKYVIPPVAAGCVMQFLYTMYVNVEQFEKRTIGMAVASIVAAVVNFVLNYFFIPRYGYIAAAYTTYISYLVLFIVHVLLVRSIGRSKVYNNRGICIIAVGVAVYMILVNVILDNIWLRYGILTAAVIVGVFITVKSGVIKLIMYIIKK